MIYRILSSSHTLFNSEYHQNQHKIILNNVEKIISNPQGDEIFFFSYYFSEMVHFSKLLPQNQKNFIK